VADGTEPETPRLIDSFSPPLRFWTTQWLAPPWTSAGERPGAELPAHRNAWIYGAHITGGCSRSPSRVLLNISHGPAGARFDGTLRLYNSDLMLAAVYCWEKKIFPLALVEADVEGEVVRALDARTMNGHLTTSCPVRNHANPSGGGGADHAFLAARLPCSISKWTGVVMSWTTPISRRRIHSSAY